MPVLFRNARILTFDESRRDLARADLLVAEGRIAAVGPDLEVATAEDIRIIDAAGKLIMPGLINAHLHSPANFLKGALEDAPLEIFMLYEVPPMGDTPDSPRVHYLRTLLGAMEMLKLGITSVHDDAFFNPEPTEAALDAVMIAYRDAGMRATVAIDQPNIVEYDKLPYLADLLPRRSRPPCAQRRARAGRTARGLQGVHRPLARRGGGPTSVFRLLLGSAAGDAGLPPRADRSVACPRSAVSTSTSLKRGLQRVLGAEKFGKSLVRYVDDLGALDERKVVIHSIWWMKRILHAWRRPAAALLITRSATSR